MAKTQREPFIEFTGGRYIDPESVGSGINWRFAAEVFLRDEPYISSSGEIALSDCSRVISWVFDLDNPHSIYKLDAAISELQEARRKLALSINRVQDKKSALGIKE